MDWLVGELKPWVDATFRTKTEREFTYVSGSSMGGLMTVYAVTAYNDVFSKGAALSSSLWVSGTGINDMIKNKDLRFLFRPIVDPNKKYPVGYFQYTRAYDTPLSNFVELSRYARKTNENRNLLSYVARQVLPKFASEKKGKNPKLFFHLSLFATAIASKNFS